MKYSMNTMGEPSNTSESKEDLIAKLRENVETWRYKRYEKLSNRLLRGKENSDRDKRIICPSILGIACPSNLRSVQDPIRTNPLSDLNINSGPSKTGTNNARKREKIQRASVPRQTVTSTLRAIQNNPYLLKEKYCSYNTRCSKENNKSETSKKIDPVFCSTPVAINNRLEMSNCISEIKSQKPQIANIDLQKCLNYE